MEALRQKGLGPMPIASAMLGGALGLLASVMDDNAILNVLHSAATGVSTGELRKSLGATLRKSLGVLKKKKQKDPFVYWPRASF